MISYLIDGGVRLDDREDIINHITSFFFALYTNGHWDEPSLNNLPFDNLS